MKDKKSADARFSEAAGTSQPLGIDHHVEQALGDALRKAFSFITDEPVPDRFLQIVEELARTEKG